MENGPPKQVIFFILLLLFGCAESLTEFLSHNEQRKSISKV